MLSSFASLRDYRLFLLSINGFILFVLPSVYLLVTIPRSEG